ncbi:MAG: UDP-N-acetylmuramoyl-L-alanyl-D-glutamate--2,6-diaminopimelate ligase [Candidatus Puniceispirillum sp.]|nr:UDP-N-acetylmuramoyl-L-alanyl-D-glutamate--2,6-diaminopimelate ligase [Candidatus Pelagibacter sp.]MBA4283723.1 UDP-N-acetylmuramoyl-L-alanyl-D-glutamate--2,6-diaminopimelate ligase [Candidatus Puniceispirillum sp.]
MQLNDALKAIKKENLNIPWPFNTYNIEGVSVDSRMVTADEIFIAVPCPHVYDNILSALKKGCKIVIAELEVCDQYFNKHDGVLFLVHENPRLALCHILNFLYPNKPENLYAVTGTNGKSSTVHFIKQLLEINGSRAATIGTLGVEAPLSNDAMEDISKILDGVSLTTLDPIRLHKILQKIKENNIDHVAFEASSHGLHQYRIHDLKVNRAAFTNLTQDHLDYHRTMESYFEAKKILFTEILTSSGTAFINIDDHWGHNLAQILKTKEIKVVTFSTQNPSADVEIMNIRLSPIGSIFDVRYGQNIYFDIACSLIADFQISNAITAALLISNDEQHFISQCRKFNQLRSVEGRMETFCFNNDIHIFVDFAHTPDALEKVLKNVSKVCQGDLHLVFGCGGNRDVEKRPIMGAIASSYAHKIYITDDNPRLEDPQKIRNDIINGIKNGDQKSVQIEEFSNRKQAIIEAIKRAKKNDCIVVAGKGHEKYQIIGQTFIPFSDSEIVKNEIDNIEKK